MTGPKSPPAVQRAPPRSRWRLALITLFAAPFLLAAIGAAAAMLATLLINDRLPPLDALVEYKPRIPLRIYTADGVLIGEYGEERRTFVPIAEVPQVMKDAIIAAEDSRFFDHVGIDLIGVARAALVNLLSGGTEQGASTITMQLAREFFLSPERTYARKLVEILIALRIEDALSKEQILELYINQIFLGKRAYGFAAAAQTYFGKPLAALSAAEAAMLAGLPKAPSRFNPIVNPRRATERQRYILKRMRDAGFLSEADYQTALNEPLKLASARPERLSLAPYVAEAARQQAWELFRQDTYSAGIVVHTTIVSTEQRVANEAVRKGVVDYDRRYGYRGPEAFIELSTTASRAREQIADAIDDADEVDGFTAAVVLQVAQDRVVVSTGGPTPITIRGDGLRFAASALSESAPAARRLRRGALVRIAEIKAGQFGIVQLPEVESALVAVNSDDGAVRALVGGFDFARNKFNRATQAWRQPGSSFKPFIFSAAFDRGFMTGSIVNDAPFRIDPKLTGNQLWEPRNYDNRFDGPISVRDAMARSKNMVSIRLLEAVTPEYAQRYVTRFGFEADKHPAFLTMALGAGSTTPWQMAGAYAVIANGGFSVEPHLISRITDSQGRVLAQARPSRAGDESRRAIDARNAFMVDSVLRSVIQTGTGTRAQVLKRDDLAGKTGTTNDANDAWFAGYHPKLAAVVWVGYDQPRRLGERETGGGLALPIWIDYMSRALAGVPAAPRTPPAGLDVLDGEYYYASGAASAPGRAATGSPNPVR
jgi:penicillin-binding protein 1A